MQRAPLRRFNRWALSVNTDTLLELTAIPLATFMSIQMWPHRYSFNLGYDTEELSSGTFNVFGAVLSMIVQLLAEIGVDFLSFYVEMLHNIPVMQYFDSFNAASHYVCHFFAIATSVGSIMWAFSTVPEPFFCEADDPCTCFFHTI